MKTAVDTDSKSIMTDFNKNHVFIKTFVAGGVAGMCSKTSVAPLTRIKILLQAHNIHYKHLGVFSGLKTIIKKESILGLYKGNGAQMIRVFPYAATQFASFELYKKILKENFGQHHFLKFFAGSAAGVTAVLMTYPLDVVRARLAFQVTGEHVYSGIMDTLTQIYQKEGGARALYRGIVPTILGMLPYGGISFYVFEKLKYFCLKYFPNACGREHPSSSGGLVLSVPAKLLCGGFAGAMAQTVSYPLDVARRKMQLSMMRPETHRFGKGLVKTLVLTYNEDGVVRGLYRGLSINFFRVIPMVAVSFSTYEMTKQILGLDTGLES